MENAPKEEGKMRKVIFITGATSGFGEAAAREFARHEYDLILLARRENRLSSLKEELVSKHKGIKIHTIKADVRDKKAVEESVATLPEGFKRIDILLNNAGLASGQDKFGEADVEDFEVMVDTNIKGVLYVTKSVLPRINRGGTIFNIGSVAGSYSYVGANVYGATKAFVAQLSMNLRNDLRGTGIRVTNIEPGLCKTEFSLVRFKGNKEKADAVYEGTQFVTAENIATILYNCASLPPNVNINRLEVMATSQTWAGFFFERA